MHEKVVGEGFHGICSHWIEGKLVGCTAGDQPCSYLILQMLCWLPWKAVAANIGLYLDFYGTTAAIRSNPQGSHLLLLRLLITVTTTSIPSCQGDHLLSSQPLGLCTMKLMS